MRAETEETIVVGDSEMEEIELLHAYVLGTEDELGNLCPLLAGSWARQFDSAYISMRGGGMAALQPDFLTAPYRCQMCQHCHGNRMSPFGTVRLFKSQVKSSTDTPVTQGAKQMHIERRCDFRCPSRGPPG